MKLQQSTLRRRRMRAVAGAAVAVLALGGLTACEDSGPVGDGGSDSQEPAGDGDGAGDGDDGDGADDGSSDDAGGDPAEADDGFLAAGETYTYDNGVAITLSAAEVYEPGKHVDYQGTPYKVDITVTNGGDADFDLSLLLEARAGDAGVKAERKFDSAKLNELPRGAVKPGRSASGSVAFDVPQDAGFLDVEAKFVGQRDMDSVQWNLRL